MEYILLEDLNLLLFQKNGEWEIHKAETVEMNCIRVDETYYERKRSIDMNITEVQPISNSTKEFDDFDTQISCEEYYGG